MDEQVQDFLDSQYVEVGNVQRSRYAVLLMTRKNEMDFHARLETEVEKAAQLARIRGSKSANIAEKDLDDDADSLAGVKIGENDSNNMRVEVSSSSSSCISSNRQAEDNSHNDSSNHANGPSDYSNKRHKVNADDASYVSVNGSGKSFSHLTSIHVLFFVFVSLKYFFVSVATSHDIF